MGIDKVVGGSTPENNNNKEKQKKKHKRQTRYICSLTIFCVT